MSSLNSLFQLLQLTRSQVQYGYVLSGVPKERLSDLAQHHYLVTFMAWQLALNCNQAGAKLNILKVIEISLIHDLGELFGGDINWFYARINPEARKMAKSFESENNKFLACAFGEQKRYFEELQIAGHASDSDEAKIAKLADYMECLQYKRYVGFLDKKYDCQNVVSALHDIVARITDSYARVTLRNLLSQWGADLTNKISLLDLLRGVKILSQDD